MESVNSSVVLRRKSHGELSSDGTHRLYEFVFIPNSGFLNSNLPLMNNCELKLSFDRLISNVGLLTTQDLDSGDLDNPRTIVHNYNDYPLKIENCYAVAEYISSEELNNYFARVEYDPIPYHYEDCELTLKNLTTGLTNIRIDNIKGGEIPNCIFAGIIPTSSLNGDMKKSCTAFTCNNVLQFNFTLNGNSVHGYPIDINNSSPVFPYHRFMEATNRYMNPSCGEGLKLNQFRHNWLYAHKFEGEISEEGWLGVNIKLSEPLMTPYTLVIWTTNDACITIDKFHQIEKIN